MQTECVSLWDNCLDIIKGEVGETMYNTWFKPIQPLKFKENVLTIQVPSQYFYEWLEEHYVGVLKKAITESIGEGARLEYSVIIDKGNKQSSSYSVQLPNTGRSNNSNYNKGNNNPYTSPFHVPEVGPNLREPYLNRNFTFENFVEGDCNRLARSAGYAVAQKPGVTSFNPLMFYGGVGLGKTHLVQAIGNEIKNKFNNKFVLYVSSEKFTNQFIEALRNNKIQEFQHFYMQVDVLIIDDVQFLAKKEKTQEIFFHIFNHLHQLGQQIIMTSDKPPRDLKGLEERLLSRFKWGLTADLQQPDYETRVAIIRTKMENDGLVIPDEVTEYLAYSVDTNIRELEGVLISLIAHASLNRVEIDLELARQTLKNIISDIDTVVDIDYIQKSVAEYFDVHASSLKDKIRKKEIVIARQVAMYLAKEFTRHSLKAIGMHFGGRDHSTVIHSIQAVDDLMDTNATFKATVQ
ncbi:MAG: chromosomal replication initiator protein DnaA, partial [Cyclobacteriaceae bacterium]|nr:chromosomal replication initiator protein DnaA [Cyclobacteriaceae bacterium]